MMSKKVSKKTVRAWRDPLFRASLKQEERDALARHPSGDNESGESDLDEVVGGFTLTSGCGTLDCGGFTQVCFTLGPSCGTQGAGPTCWSSQPYVCSTCCNGCGPGL
jgi:mersacidin/lichenicidin family type 2 lantibiotic